MNTQLVTGFRRRRCAAGLGARFEHGRYLIYGQNGVHSGDEAHTQNGQVDTQIEQASDKEDSQESSPVFLILVFLSDIVRD